MTGIQSVPWLRIGAESIAIIGSILLAFAIDASWDSHVERAEEQVYLAALQVQFEQSLDQLQSHVVALENAREATRLILSINEADLQAIEWEDFAKLLRESIALQRINLPSGALEALVSSGDLRILTDRELAARLANWSSLIAEGYENATLLIENRENHLHPLLAEHRINALQFAPQLADFPPSRFQPSLETLYADPRLDSILAVRAAQIGGSLNRHRTLASEAATILASIQRNIDKLAGSRPIGDSNP